MGGPLYGAGDVSGPGVIEAEKSGWCRFCGAHAETRPYGPNGEEICFECAMSPERKAITEKQFRKFVLGEP